MKAPAGGLGLVSLLPLQKKHLKADAVFNVLNGIASNIISKGSFYNNHI